jgi:hypothetical protein
MQIPENKMQLLKGLAFISSILAMLVIFVAVENRLNVEKQIDEPTIVNEQSLVRVGDWSSGSEPVTKEYIENQMFE